MKNFAVGSRCLTLQSGCLVTWIYNCLSELVVEHPNKPFSLLILIQAFSYGEGNAVTRYVVKTWL